MRKEQRLDFKIFLFLIDLCICNVYCFHEKIFKGNNDKLYIWEFKCRILFDLTLKDMPKEETSVKSDNHFMLKFKYKDKEIKKKKGSNARKILFMQNYETDKFCFSSMSLI